MKHHTRIIALFLVVLALVSTIPGSTAYAAASSIYITPSSGTFTAGAGFTVQVRGTSDNYGYMVGGLASGQLTFPSAYLSVTSTSTSGSTFPNMSVAPDNSAGVIDFSGSKSPAPSGNFLLFTVSFKTKKAGTAAVAFSTNTYINPSSYFNPTTNRIGGSYTINAPPAPAPAPTPTPTPTPTPAPAPAPTPVEATTPPAEAIAPIEEEAATEVETSKDTSPADDTELLKSIRITRHYTTAILSWDQSQEATTTVKYGASRTTLSKNAEVRASDDGTRNATLTNLEPGRTYFFELSAVTPEKQTDSYTGTFSARGYPVVIVATDGDKILAGATITLGGKKYETDKNGSLTLELAAGSHAATLKTGSASRSVTLAVQKKSIPPNGTPPTTQELRIDLRGDTATARTSILPLILSGIAGVGGLGGAVVGFLLWRRRRNEQPSTDMTDQDYRALLATYQRPIEPRYTPSADALPSAPLAAAAVVPPVDPTPAATTSAPAEAAPLSQAPISTPAPEPTPPLPPLPEAIPSDISEPQPAASELPLPPPAPIAPDYPAAAPSAAILPNTPPEPISVPQPIATPTPQAVTPFPQAPAPTPQPEPVPLTPPLPPTPEPPAATTLTIDHPHNSVYIDEEEPLDMFEAARRQQTHP